MGSENYNIDDKSYKALIFPVLKEIIKPNGVDYFGPLKQYVMYLLEDKAKRNELSILQIDQNF